MSYPADRPTMPAPPPVSEDAIELADSLSMRLGALEEKVAAVKGVTDAIPGAIDDLRKMLTTILLKQDSFERIVNNAADDAIDTHEGQRQIIERLNDLSARVHLLEVKRTSNGTVPPGI